jgi:phosphatidylethanolamine-binding protein (PEBP) family uncharacterized protein
MRLRSDSFKDAESLPSRYALGRPHPGTHAEFSDDVSPHLAWEDVPAGTKSFALLCVDQDVPSRGDDVNKEGRVVPVDLPRVDFYHLVLVDLPPQMRTLAEGELSRGPVKRGKPGPSGPFGSRVGLNDFTGWFQGDPNLGGQYFGYDGPWPPWNDGRVHRYHFRLYALDVPHCPVGGIFTGPEVVAAIRGRVLAEASLGFTYAIYPGAVVAG